VHRLLNNLGFAGGEEVAQLDATACTVAGNSFLGGWAATAADFAGLDEADLTRPRQPNGQLPVTSLLRLAPGSRAIDAGVPWGEPFAGRAPDAGAFEAGAAR
jgi:pectate lyase